MTQNETQNETQHEEHAKTEIPIFRAEAATVSAMEDGALLSARFFRVLGDPTRLRALRLLLDAPTGECSVGELVEALDAPQSRVSTHLGCLRWCGLVQTRRVGKQVYYRIADPRAGDILALGMAMAGDNTAGLSTCGMVD